MYALIVSNPAVLGGKPVIKGTRITVESLLELFASGATRADSLKSGPHLTVQDETPEVGHGDGYTGVRLPLNPGAVRRDRQAMAHRRDDVSSRAGSWAEPAGTRPRRRCKARVRQMRRRRR
jgi:hypothetical protein